jgi:hypothetical protein
VSIIPLCSSLSCKCNQSHGISFELFTPPLAVRADDEAALIRRVDFRLALSNDTNDLKGKRSGIWEWNEVILRMADAPKAPIMTTAQLQPNSKQTRTVRRVKFSTNSGASSSTTHVQSVTLTHDVSVRPSSLPSPCPSPRPDPLELVDLCQFLAKNSGSRDQSYSGYIKDTCSEKCSKFDVYATNSYYESQGSLSVPL